MLKNHAFAAQIFLLALLFLVSAACDQRSAVAEEKKATPAKDGGPAKKEGAKTLQPIPGHIIGRVTMADGAPPAGEIKDISIAITGTSDAGGRVSYTPAVNEDGTFKQKVLAGQYVFEPSRITVRYNKAEFALRLEPVGRLSSKNRDVADGIVQEFIWKTTGPTAMGQADGLDTTNATHWYGMSIGMRADGWRNDTNKPPTKIPDGTKLTFTLKPTGKAIDGSEIKTFTIERTLAPGGRGNADLSDLPPAPYEITGTATLPDGTVKPLLLQSGAEYPAYKPTISVAVVLDNIRRGMAKPLCVFVID